MACKAEMFRDFETHEKIMKSVSNKEIQKLGREVKNFGQQRWDAYKCSIVYGGNLCKFRQNEVCRIALLDTGDTTLVEANPEDSIWGVGLSEDDPDCIDKAKWKGTNILGHMLMEVRNRIREDLEILNSHHDLIGDEIVMVNKQDVVNVVRILNKLQNTLSDMDIDITRELGINTTKLKDKLENSLLMSNVMSED